MYYYIIIMYYYVLLCILYAFMTMSKCILLPLAHVIYQYNL
jgi:hypothetical protein